MADGKVDWRKNDVIAVIEGATDEALAAMAFEIEGLTKINVQGNGQIDTGFMLNSVYATTPTASSVGASSGTYTDRTGRSVERTAAAPISAQAGEAAVHVAAEYAVFQEVKKPFLYPALNDVAGRADAIMEPVYRDRVGE